MAEIVRAGLVQQRWTGDKESMIAAAVNHIQTAASAGAQVVCLQELFYGPYFCQVQDADYYSYTEAIPDGPTTKLLQDVARQHGIVIVAPMYEEEHPGIYYNTAAVIDADGSYLGKYRKTHIPQVKGFWEKFYFRPGNTGYPIFDTAVGRIGVYICYDRHFPEGWRALGLAGARIVFNPSATSRGLSQYLWRLEQPAAAVANEYFVGAINRVGIEPLGDNDFYGQTYFADPRGQLMGDAAADDKDEVLVRDLDMAQADRGPGTCGSLLPRPPARRLRALGPAMSTTLISGGTVVSASGTLDADVLVAGEKIAAVLARDVAAETAPAADQVIDATGKYVLPGGIDVHTHMEMPFGGTFSADTFETGTRAAAWGGTTTIIDFAVQAKGTSLLATLDKWHAKADGNCAIDYGFHMIVSDVNDTTLKEMDACNRGGVNSFKMFMAYPGVFYATRRRDPARHAAGGPLRRDRDDARGERHRHRPSWWRRRSRPAAQSRFEHGLTRPPELEGEATSRAITLAKVANCPLYIVHLSARHALEAVAEARDTPAERVRRDLPASTCGCPSRTWPGRTSRGPSSSPRRRCGPRTIRTRCGRACGPTTCRWCPRTTARSASRTRRNSAGATSPRSPTGCPASSTGWTCCTPGWPPAICP